MIISLVILKVKIKYTWFILIAAFCGYKVLSEITKVGGERFWNKKSEKNECWVGKREIMLRKTKVKVETWQVKVLARLSWRKQNRKWKWRQNIIMRKAKVSLTWISATMNVRPPMAELFSDSWNKLNITNSLSLSLLLISFSDN